MARNEKVRDKERAQQFGDVHVLMHDLQAVKLCPQLQASALYYKTKLCVHNFTMYNLTTKDVYCCRFDETNAGLTASAFISCRTTNDPTVTGLKVLQYNPDGIIKYKLSYDAEYQELPRGRTRRRMLMFPKNSPADQSFTKVHQK
ncbi:hypothetical protein EVAR_75290_1 [Eumeta japonica]|uniref:Uncharacterized protein n=1 Tax=Eumeta variegata TaxID=151549 RepID=A0A4C1YUU9_EUMVA|nr:hypothetical protein EVAR_75290_1 [Eumeta japonica]